LGLLNKIGVGFIALVALLIVQACDGGAKAGSEPVRPSVNGTLEMNLKNYAFEPKRLLFELGETVEFRLTSEDDVHTFTVQPLGINGVVPGEAVSQSQTFSFEQAGTFKLICAVPSHEGFGMTGTIEVR
jgi:plastocyanin